MAGLLVSIFSEPIGWAGLGIGAVASTCGSIASCIFGSKAESAKQEKNDAMAYSTNTATTEKEKIEYAIDEGVYPKDLKQEKIDEKLDNKTLESTNHAYLSLSKASDDGKEVTYSRYDVDSREFNSKETLGRTNKLNGFEETTISIPE